MAGFTHDEAHHHRTQQQQLGDVSERLVKHFPDAVTCAGRECALPAASDVRQNDRHHNRRRLHQRHRRCHVELASTGALEQLHVARTGRLPKRMELFIPSLFAWHALLAVPHVQGLVLFVHYVSDRVRREW